MNRKEIIKMFSSRSDKLIAAWPEAKTLEPMNIPQGPGGDELINLVKKINKKKKISSVLDVGCGLGRWAPFWTEGIGVKRYTGIEPTPELAAEAERRFEGRSGIEIILGELIDQDTELGRRSWDLGFTFTVLEHIPPADIAPVVEIIKRRTKRVLLVEMVKAGKGADFCEYVFKHDYQELFGPWKFSVMLDANKALMYFEA